MLLGVSTQSAICLAHDPGIKISNQPIITLYRLLQSVRAITTGTISIPSTGVPPKTNGTCGIPPLASSSSVGCSVWPQPNTDIVNICYLRFF
jgi:hypothetical protein